MRNPNFDQFPSKVLVEGIMESFIYGPALATVQKHKRRDMIGKEEMGKVVR